MLRLLHLISDLFFPACVSRHRRGGASYSPPSPQPLNVDAVLAAIAPVLGYENIGYFKFFAADHAPKELDDHVCTDALLLPLVFELTTLNVCVRL